MESKPKKKSAPKKKSSGKAAAPGRKIGYAISAIIMLAILYVLRHLQDWGVNFLNQDFDKALFYIALSIYVSIAAQVLFIFYDNRWFKHFTQAVVNVFNALSIIMIYVIFPFNFGDASWVKWFKIILLVVFAITVITIPVELFKGVRDLTRDPEKV